MFYSVVLLDGKELHCLTLEEVRDLFFKRQINQDSLCCDAENPQWQMLKRAFDLSQWISSGAPPVNSQSSPNNPFQSTNPVNQPPVNPFEQPNPLNQSQTFNQFPPNQTNHSNNYFGQKGYSQNNQTETYYQAETNQTDYNFQNNPPDIAPSQYSNPANSYNYSPANFNSAQNSTNKSAGRSGSRQAAVFLIINAIFYAALLIIESVFLKPGEQQQQEQFQMSIGKSIIPFIIDLVLAVNLWKQNNIETTRKWVLVRTYFGFIVFGLIFPFFSLQTGDFFVGIFSFVSLFLYFISLAIVLHGKENPSPSRVILGMGTFAIYFLVMFGTIAFAVVGNLAPNIAQFEIENKQFDKYKIEGKEFEDKTTGAKVVLPEGWSMISLNNPIIHTPEARMIAVDSAGKRLTMLEVVPVPAQLDLKRQNSTFILDELANGVVKSMKKEDQNRGGFGKNSFNEITRLSIFIGKHPAKLLVFDKTTNGVKAKGHFIITYDELTFYVLHSWCPAEDYDKSQNDFTFFEKNFSVPEKINSTFTQTAETLKK